MPIKKLELELPIIQTYIIQESTAVHIRLDLQHVLKRPKQKE